MSVTVDVYGDILFLINAGMDALCLMLTARLLHIPCKTWRLLTASALGGVYAVIVLLWEVPQPWSVGIDLAVCLLMCAASFLRQGESKRLLMQGVVYMAISMVMGGMMTALYHLLHRAGVTAWLPGGEDGLSSFAFLLLAGCGGLFTYVWGRFFKKSHRIQVCTLTIRMGEHTVTLRGMIDSGNLLKDPMGGGVVIPVNIHAVLPILSREMGDFLKDQTTKEVWELPEASRIRLIPAGTATGEGMLIALRPDDIRLIPEGKTPYAVKALVAPITMSAAPADALVPADLLH